MSFSSGQHQETNLLQVLNGKSGVYLMLWNICPQSPFWGCTNSAVCTDARLNTTWRFLICLSLLYGSSVWLLPHNYTVAWAGRDIKNHLGPTLCHRQGALPPDQATQSPVKSGLKHHQGKGIHSFLSNKIIPKDFCLVGSSPQCLWHKGLPP